jgi:hypothetical protein
MLKVDPVREAIRPLVESSKAVSRTEIAKKFGVGVHAVQIAELLERGRLEGLREAASPSGQKTVVLTSDEITKGLDPVIKKLRVQAKANLATISFAGLAVLAHELEKLMERWTQ